MEMEQWLLWLKYTLLGIVQGVTEPIPVSSSGHVIIAQRLMGLEQQGLTFEILTNTASLIAICFIYRQEIIRLIVHTLKFIGTRQEGFYVRDVYCRRHDSGGHYRRAVQGSD
jgi:undecaprenyl-diphosphatase